VAPLLRPQDPCSPHRLLSRLHAPQPPPPWLAQEGVAPWRAAWPSCAPSTGPLLALAPALLVRAPAASSNPELNPDPEPCDGQRGAAGVQSAVRAAGGATSGASGGTPRSG